MNPTQTQATAAGLTLAGPGWTPPKARLLATGARWGDWWRWGRHAAGAYRRALQADAEQADQLRRQAQDWDDAKVDARLAELRRSVRLGHRDAVQAREVRVQAVACVALAAQRTTGQSPYTVQLLAALGMHEGLLVQMAAGEGKTLAVALAGVLHGWRGLPCHIVTANDYLAQRDAQLMEPIYRRCGVSVAAVVHGLDPQALRQAYACDVVYATSKQLLADHLFDQISLEGATDAVRRRVRGLAEGPVAVRSRGLHVAIVDEADSVLIDEANTPLIISAPQPNPLLVSAVLAARDVAEELQAGRDYRVDLKFRDIEFTEEGQARVEALTQRLPPVWHAPERRDDLLRQALSARELYLRDRHYIVQDGKIEILDENTGRVMPGRSWSYGLHQAIEAREGVQITHPSRTMARMSFQEFFRHYHRLGGASGTLQGVRQELWWTYGLLTLVVPTRLPSRLQVPAPRHFADAQAKWDALVAQVQALHRQGHPVLVGTRRLSDSETLQQRLAERGLHCAVLNAKQHAHEAAVVAAAGQPGCITVATNMAGRGTDIHLPPGVAERGGLHVLMLEPHESVRVDWQLYGRAGRQGQPGHAQAYVALDDDLLARHLPFWLAPLRALMARSPAWRGALMASLIGWCQRRAQARAFLQRRYLQQRERELRKQLSFADKGVG
ncbi:MAG: hypothetical protein RLZ83_267 [Pseudomonadota bacterium]